MKIKLWQTSILISDSFTAVDKCHMIANHSVISWPPEANTQRLIADQSKNQSPIIMPQNEKKCTFKYFFEIAKCHRLLSDWLSSGWWLTGNWFVAGWQLEKKEHRKWLLVVPRFSLTQCLKKSHGDCKHCVTGALLKQVRWALMPVNLWAINYSLLLNKGITCKHLG